MKKSQKQGARKPKSASKPSTPLGRIRGAIGQKENWRSLQLALESAKLDAPPTEYARLLGLANQSTLLAIAMPAASGKALNARAQSVEPLAAASLTREIVWTCILLAARAKKLSAFARQRDNFFFFFLRGDFDTALLELDYIDERCGLSLWSIENRIALLAAQGGFEAQKNFVGKISKDFPGTFLSFFASNIGERNEARVTARGYESRLRERADKWKIESSRKTYVLFKLLDSRGLPTQDLADVLAHEAASNLLDLYETATRLLIRIRVDGNSLSQLALDAISTLAMIDDHRAARLVALWDVPVLSTWLGRVGEPPYEEQQYLLAFLCGEYESAALAVRDWLVSHPEDATALAIGGQLAAMGYPISLPNTAPISLVVAAYESFYRGEEGSEDAVGLIQKLSLNLRHAALSTSLMGPISSRTAAAFAVTPSMSVETAVCVPIANPEVFITLGGVYSSEQLRLRPALADSDLWKALSNDYSELDCLSREARAYAALAEHLRDGQFDHALEAVGELAKSDHSYFRRDAALCRAFVLYRRGDLEQALETSVQLIVDTPALGRAVPLAEIVRSRGYKQLKALQKSLALSSAFFLFQEIYGTRSKDVALKVAWRQLLAGHGVTRPSELARKPDAFTPSLLTFFLAEVCVQEVMELGKSFKSPGDLDRERIEICRFLSSFDAANFDAYGAEIVELTRRVSIEEGVKALESSRIYVDVIGIQRWAEAKLAELFFRYQDYEKLGLTASVDELRKNLNDILRSRKVAPSAVQDYLKSVDISADTLIEEILIALAVAFLSLPRYGLDSFLSSRVRHGSLVINLRGCFERFHLITKINSQTNEYEPNTYWSSQVCGPSRSDAHSSLEGLLNRFARTVDGILDEALVKRIHVKSEAKAEGLLGFTENLSARGTLIKSWVIAVKLAKATDSLAHLIAFTTQEMFWPAMTASLQNAQAYVRGELAESLRQALMDLRSDVLRGFPAESGWLLSNIDSAAEELERSSERVSKWFSPPQKSELEFNYTVQTGMEIGLRSMQTLDSSFDPNIVWNIEVEADAGLSSAGFGLLNDLSFLVFGNIRKHAGFGSEPGLDSNRPDVWVTAKLVADRTVELLVSNNLAPSCDREEIRRNVLDAQSQIAARQFESATQKISKSGLVRLAATLDYENFHDDSLQFGLRDDDIFFVRLHLPPASLKVADGD